MRKLILAALLVGTGLSTISCRETTQEKTKDAMEAIGEDIEDNTRKAAEKVEEGAEKVKREVQEEINNTDDVN